MDFDKLCGIVVKWGIMDEDVVNWFINKECFNFIFMFGFFSKEKIIDILGCGVGMDVVKIVINILNGLIDIDFIMGKGIKIIIKVFLILVIFFILMVGVVGYLFVLFLVSVNEIFYLDLCCINVVDG